LHPARQVKQCVWANVGPQSKSGQVWQVPPQLTQVAWLQVWHVAWPQVRQVAWLQVRQVAWLQVWQVAWSQVRQVSAVGGHCGGSVSQLQVRGLHTVQPDGQSKSVPQAKSVGQSPPQLGPGHSASQVSAISGRGLAAALGALRMSRSKSSELPTTRA
jgi:hypothetical protein